MHNRALLPYEKRQGVANEKNEEKRQKEKGTVPFAFTTSLNVRPVEKSYRIFTLCK